MSSDKLIAEHKPRSPSGWEGPAISVEDFIARHRFAAAYAVHAQEPWGGSWDLVERARAATRKPLWVKGILSYREAARAAGIGALPLLIEGRNAHMAGGFLAPVVEVASVEQLHTALWREPSFIVVNARDLDTGQLHPERHDNLRAHIPPGIAAVAASGLTEPREDYDLSLIGTALMEAAR